MSTKRTIIGIIAGAAAGAVAGVLLAPDKGSVTRRKIADKSSSAAKKVGEKFEDIVDGVGQRIDNLKEDTLRMGKRNNHHKSGVETEFVGSSKS